MIASQFDTLAPAIELEFVIHRHRLHHRFQFVKTVGTFAQNIEQEIDLAGGLASQRHQ